MWRRFLHEIMADILKLLKKKKNRSPGCLSIGSNPVGGNSGFSFSEYN